ncbi:MAG TPA: serine/threonine-protein kinase [Gemmatimonadales bacterium]|nr:serine/threonine-protein kinase [Gemmatimonadales bacterium]
MTDLRPGLSEALAGRYAIERELGRGGMARVYLARDLKHGRRVALKVLRPEVAEVIGADRFVREIGILAQLAHPHVLPLHDSGAADGQLFYVMPYVEGETLRARLERERQLPVEEAVRIAGEVAGALAYAHGRGVVHRDIKPENILLEAGHAVVADFGIARVINETGGRITATGLAVGTPAYMSPEQASGDRSVDHRTDVYALGTVLYEMLAGETPHTGPTPQAILARTLTETPRPLRRVRAEVPEPVDRVVRRALARSPADRFATAAEFGTALREAATGAAAMRPVRAGRAWKAAAGVAAVAGLALLLRTLLGGGPSDRRLGLAVFPFLATVARADQYTEQLPDLLATMLDGIPGVRVADPWALWGALRPSRGARARSPAGLEDAERLARRARAGMFLLGTIQQSERGGDDAPIAVTTRVYRVGSAEAIETVTDSAPPDSLGTLVHRIAVAVITRVRPAATAPAAELEGFTTRSPEAIKAYLRAKEAMRRGQVDTADAEIEAALRGDSTFAVALVEAAHIKSWSMFMRGQVFTGLFPLIQRAERYADSLSPRNRLRLESTRASIRTDGARAAAAAREILALDSTDVGAWLGLGYYHRVYGWQYGAGEEDAIDALERAIALDSTYVPAMVSLLSGLQQADDPRAERAAELLRRSDTSSALARGALLAHRVLLMDDEAYAGFVDTLARYDPLLMRLALRAVRTNRPDRAIELLGRLRDRQGPGIPDYRPEWGRMLAATGRFRELDSALRAGTFPTQTLPRFFLLAPALLGAGDTVLAAQAAAFLHGFIPPDSALAMFERMPVWGSGWMVGAWHAMQGDTATARRWQSVIGTFPAGGTPDDYRVSLQADIESRLLARRGDRAGALAAATRAYDQWGIHTENTPEHDAEPQIRFHYAMQLLANQRADSAATLLRSLVPPVTWMGNLTARAALELGRLMEARGDRAAALRHYSLANRLYRAADPALAHLQSAARDGLSRLTAEPAR